MSFTRPQYMLKYQKAKVKLLEYEVDKVDYPNFKLNYRDLHFMTIFYVSEYANAVVDGNDEAQKKNKKFLQSCAEFYDAAFKSREQVKYDIDFLLIGAVSYFFQDSYGSAAVLVNELKNRQMPQDARGVLANILSYIFGGSLLGDVQDEIVECLKNGAELDFSLCEKIKAKRNDAYMENDELGSLFGIYVEL